MTVCEIDLEIASCTRRIMYYVIILQMPPVIMIRSLNNQLIIRRSETLPTAVADNDWYVHSSTSVVLTPGSRRPQPLDLSPIPCKLTFFSVRDLWLTVSSVGICVYRIRSTIERFVLRVCPVWCSMPYLYVLVK